MPHLEIKLFGAPRITLDGIALETDRHKAIGLLAYLAVEARSHSREALAALLWPDYPRASAFSYLRRTLWELNQMLGKGWITADREKVALEHLPGLEIDAAAFQRLLAVETDPIDALSEAVALYQGDFLQGLVIADTVPFEAWQTQQAEHYRRQLAHTLERLTAAHEQNGAYASALPHAQRWQSLDNLDEMAARAVMRQLAGMGDRGGAIRAYQACLKTLADELDISPQPETEQLYQAILHGEAPGRQASAALTPSAEVLSPCGYLPTPATPFIGRAVEIKQIVQLASDPGTHLLTLTGPGGTGKTRLSIQAAAQMAEVFQDGAWFISLATVQSFPELIQAIAKGLSFSFYKEGASPRQQLLDYLRQKHLLLVLDNFEQLVEFGRELVADILAEAPQVKLLVTSRERLNLQTECIYRVHGMRTPDAQIASGWDDPEEQARPYSAIQLLLERARQVRPDFHLTQENLGAVTQICRLVEGSPLGIELAVAWLELLSPQEIAQEITRSLDFLESEAADIPARQRSLRAVFETSWNLLADEEQQALRRLCVFPGSFSRQAAQWVSKCTLRTLLRLVNTSWLQTGENDRFTLHEVLRQYGLERLQENQDEWCQAKDRHAEFFATFIQTQDKALRTDGQIQARQAMVVELESNIPAAWHWLVLSERIDILLENMLPGLFKYWIMLIFADEFIPWLKFARQSIPDSTERQHLLQRVILETIETSLELSSQVYDEQPKERLEALWTLVKEADLVDQMGFWYLVLLTAYGNHINYEQGFRQMERFLPKAQAFNDPWILGICYLYGNPTHIRPENETGKRHLLDALAIFQQLGVVYEQGIALLSLGGLAASEKDYQRAIEYTELARPLFKQVGSAHDFIVLWNLAEYYLSLGNSDQALQFCEEMKPIAENTGNRRLLAEIIAWQSRVLARYGKLDDALETGKTSLKLAYEISNAHDIAWHTWELGEVYRLMGDLPQARAYYQQALPFFEGISDFVGLGFYHRGLADIAMMQGDWEGARQKYLQALAVQEKEQRSLRNWGLAFYHARLGTVLVQLGDFDEARQHMRTSLSLAQQWVHPDVKALPLTGIASLLAATGFPMQAIEVAACVAAQPTTWNEVKQQARAILEAAKGEISPDEAQFAQARGKEMNIDDVIRLYLDHPKFSD